jgi:hypothetical protein
LVAYVENRNDIRMIQRGHCLRFLLEPPKAIAITGKRFRKDLQGDVATEPRVAGLVNLAHAACANW